MQALAERLANQEKVKDATQRAYLPQAELDELSETHTWLRESFGLTASPWPPTALETRSMTTKTNPKATRIPQHR